MKDVEGIESEQVMVLERLKQNQRQDYLKVNMAREVQIVAVETAPYAQKRSCIHIVNQAKKNPIFLKKNRTHIQ